MIFMIIGHYFSSQFLKAHLVKNYFRELRRNKYEEDQTAKHLPINFPMTHMVLEPIISLFIALFCFCKFCKRKCKPKRTQLLLDKGIEKIERHLEITKVLRST